MNRSELKQLAAGIAGRVGLINLTRGDLCRAAKVPEGSFTKLAGCDFGQFIDELLADGVPLNGDTVGRRRHAAPALRRRQILEAALELARDSGPGRVTMLAVAERVGVSKPLVARYFGSMENLRHAIMAAAIERGDDRVIGFGVVEKDPQALKLSAPEQSRAVALLIGKN